MRSFTINKNDSGQRLDKFIGKAVPALPKSLMYKYLRTKRIKRNGRRCEISDRLCEGDVIELYINDEFFPQEGDLYEFMRVPPTLNIIYEDENIILIDKPTGLVVHEDDENTADTLINRILRYLFEKGEYSPEKESSFTPSLCNRIDRNTSGIVIAAKNAEALRIMNAKIKEREIEKHYLCITVGTPPGGSGTARAYLKKDEKRKQVYISGERQEGAKTIITSYRTLKTAGELSLVEVGLLTGRTHQIRAHMAYLGCPLLGDGKYGRGDINRRYGMKTQALCSYKLAFRFKTDGGALDYLDGREFEVADLPFVERFFGRLQKFK